MSNVYTLDPSTVIFDDKFVVYNPLHNDLEYASTKANIEKLGQLDPILMLNGKCIDGRHRTKIASELGIPVRCVDVDPTLDDESIIILCNKNIMSGRDYDSSQKAIQALELVNKYKMSVTSAAMLLKVDRKAVSYAGTIKGLGRQDILNTLLDDKKNRIQLDNMDRPSRSLELLAKYVKAEKEKHTVVVDDSERIQWEPDAYIKTELGKAWYYSTMHMLNNLGIVAPLAKYEVGKLLSEMANLKFKLEKVQDEPRE